MACIPPQFLPPQFTRAANAGARAAAADVTGYLVEEHTLTVLMLLQDPPCFGL